jgi:hypothetical protein
MPLAKPQSRDHEILPLSVSLTYETLPAIAPACEPGGTKLCLPRFAPMERFFLSILCASTALLVAAFVATNPIAVADNQSPQVPVLRLVQR